ncbi:MAG TPA: DNA-processing protein DprA [Gemmatimonadota bacterium]|nr:DNA-processing protein DprA [Gemmatimonadota bacterium]
MRAPADGTHRAAPLRIDRSSPLFPPLLRTISDPPERLWARGDAALLSAIAVAVVGSRKATGLGLEMSERLGAGLGTAGVVVVSGCAIGIDAAAHRGALRVGGATVAVLAGGLDVAVPPSNRSLAARIVAAGGCLTGEFPDGVPVARWAFPQRNRIIAGLARVVVVVEAAARSGALITARHALAAGREVMAVPGHPLQPEHAGSNALLCDGARPVTRVEDVLEEVGELPPLETGAPFDPRPASELHATGLPARVRSALGSLPQSAESLARTLGLPLRAVLGALTELELLGLARVCPGQRYALPPPVESRRSMDAPHTPD